MKMIGHFMDFLKMKLVITKISDEYSSPKKTPSQRFTLRVALRTRTPANQQEKAEDKKPEGKIKSEEVGKSTSLKLPTPSSPPHSNSDSEDDRSQSFLEKRAMNIKSNKAMLAQLMADLQKMPDSLLNPAGGRQKRPHKRAPRSSVAPSEARRNPERVSRRHTRSMGVCEDALQDEKDLELSLEEELLQVDMETGILLFSVTVHYYKF
ncbi:hypothetical protein JZ751_021177, partial [Albula glossodonta]